jgi:hypothetical protein
VEHREEGWLAGKGLGTFPEKTISNYGEIGAFIILAPSSFVNGKF